MVAGQLSDDAAMRLRMSMALNASLFAGDLTVAISTSSAAVYLFFGTNGVSI